MCSAPFKYTDVLSLLLVRHVHRELHVAVFLVHFSLPLNGGLLQAAPQPLSCSFPSKNLFLVHSCCRHSIYNTLCNYLLERHLAIISFPGHHRGAVCLALRLFIAAPCQPFGEGVLCNGTSARLEILAYIGTHM